MIKTRFAPSPTGYLHLGNVRTALFNDLLARQRQGICLLRIEDTDSLRAHSDFAVQLQQDLQWLGLTSKADSDSIESPVFQSQRQAIYLPYYERLQAMGAAYPCFCTEEALKKMRDWQQKKGQAPRYVGTCSRLSYAEVKSKQAQGLTFTLRFRVSPAQKLKYKDGVKGEQCFDSSTLGDFIIRRADGSAAFLFCNALDDALMGVTHVLRGEDHVSNTPRQQLVLQALGLSIPQYFHLPLITTAAMPLSKRAGSFSLKELREKGYLPIGLQNYLARLGHSYTQAGLMSLEQLAAHFKIGGIHKAPAHFDEVQLRFWQKKAVQKQNQIEFWSWLGAETQALVPESVQPDFMNFFRGVILFPAEGLAWAQILFEDLLQWDDPARIALKAVDTALWPAVIQAIQKVGFNREALSQALKGCLNHYPENTRKLAWHALRVALTGRLKGPALAEIILLLGIGRSCRRLEKCLAMS